MLSNSIIAQRQIWTQWKKKCSHAGLIASSILNRFPWSKYETSLVYSLEHKVSQKILFTDSKISTYRKPPLVPHSLKIWVLIYISSERYSFWLLNHPLHRRNPLDSYWDRPCNRTFACHSKFFSATFLYCAGDACLVLGQVEGDELCTSLIEFLSDACIGKGGTPSWVSGACIISHSILSVFESRRLTSRFIDL